MAGFSIFNEDRSLRFTPHGFGEKGATQTAGGPVLAKVVMPQRKEITEWTHREAFAFSVDFYFDSFAEGEGLEIEQEIRKLERMMGIDEGDPEPPHVIVQGDPPGCIPHDFHDNSRGRWWVSGVAYDDDKTERNSAGNRIRVFGIINLTEVNEGQLLTEGGIQPKSVTQTRYTVKKGDTLTSIARKQKVAGGWQALAKLNKIRDPKRITVGQVIRLK